MPTKRRRLPPAKKPKFPTPKGNWPNLTPAQRLRSIGDSVKVDAQIAGTALKAGAKDVRDTIKGGTWLAGYKAKEAAKAVAKPIQQTLKGAGEEIKYLTTPKKKPSAVPAAGKAAPKPAATLKAQIIRQNARASQPHDVGSDFAKGLLKVAKPLDSYKKGGIVKKTGPANLHKGERVLKKSDADEYEKMRRKVFGLGKK